MPAVSTSTSIDRRTQTATIHVQGDVSIPTANGFYDQLRGAARRRDVRKVVVDFEGAKRVDSSALAIISLGRRWAKRSGKTFELEHLHARQRAALELIPDTNTPQVPPEVSAHLGLFHGIGAYLIEFWSSTRAFGVLLADTGRQLGAVIARRKRLPKGAMLHQLTSMGVDALPIVSLLALLLGATLAFQGVVLLQRFGAGLFVADMTGMAMVREFAPMMTAIILTGRTGAAIAAELGTMRVRGEIDALSAMGVSPTRFLLLPRLLALTLVQPALTLFAIFVGIGGGMLVTSLALHLPPTIFWDRVVERVGFGDFVHGMVKSFVFAWIIGFTGSFLGMRASGDASSVGAATTRSVVVGVFLIILVDAVAATLGAL